VANDPHYLRHRYHVTQWFLPIIQTTQKKQEGELLDHRQWIGDATCPKCFPDISDKKTVKI